MESFTNSWCQPVEGSIFYKIRSEKSTKYDARDLFIGKTRTIENTTHFGDDDIIEQCYVTTPDSINQAITFKFSKGSMKIDKYSIEFTYNPLTSWRLEGANPITKIWDCLDHRKQKLVSQKRYTFHVSNCDTAYSSFRLQMDQPNSCGNWIINLHYINFHGDYQA